MKTILTIIIIAACLTACGTLIIGCNSGGSTVNNQVESKSLTVGSK